MKQQNGFTLVEIAIVLLLIGVATGAVIKGNDMLQTSRKMSVNAQVASITKAYEGFVKKYDALPGDMSNATVRLPNCSGTCANGNGDTFIGTPDRPITADNSGGNDTEYTQVWEHLQKSGFIEKSITPVTDAGGVLSFKSINQDLCYAAGRPAKLAGVWLVWQSQVNVGANAAPVISPREAMIMDRKYDDGNPGWGKIRAGGVANFLANSDGCKTDPDNYAVSDNRTCYMMFQISENPTL